MSGATSAMRRNKGSPTDLATSRRCRLHAKSAGHAAAACSPSRLPPPQVSLRAAACWERRPAGLSGGRAGGSRCEGAGQRSARAGLPHARATRLDRPRDRRSVGTSRRASYKRTHPESMEAAATAAHSWGGEVVGIVDLEGEGGGRLGTDQVGASARHAAARRARSPAATSRALPEYP